MRPVLIAGPTASGKSALALRVAERDRGIVINADALQVYAGWRVLTARPGPAELARAPHALYGHVAMDAAYSVGAWLRDLAPVLARAAADRLRPVIVGGTGLYLSALVEGLAAIPAIPAEVRARAEAAAASGRLDALRDDLARRDPASYASIDVHNPARVQRAWEVLEATGRGIVEWQRERSRPLLPAASAVRLVVSPDPAALNRKIAARFTRMLAEGALEECRAVLAAGWDPRAASSKALGAAALIAHLRGEIDLDAAAASAIVQTRRFAKRQRTWLRSRMSDWAWHAPDPAATASLFDAVPRD